MDLNNYDKLVLNNLNTKYYSYKDKTLTSKNLYESLLSNKDNINYYINRASKIVINVGNYELNNYKELNDEIIIDYLLNMYNTLKYISINSTAKIFLINIYDKGNYKLINQKLDDYCKDLKIEYIDLNKIITTKSEKIYLDSKVKVSIKESISKKG